MSASDDFDEFYTDFMKKFKELFGEVNPDMFDVDFFIVNEKDIKDNKIPRNFDKNKGFKISYRKNPETGKPEIKIDGDIDRDLLKKYMEYFKSKDLKDLKNLNFKQLNDKKNPETNKILDASELTLTPCPKGEESCEIEPYTELNKFDSFSEIIFEAPGIDIQDVILTLSDEGKKLSFSAQNQSRTYSKTVLLPFESDLGESEVQMNNGIVILKVKRKMKKE